MQGQINEIRLKEAKSKASALTNDICTTLENELCHALVKAFRAGMEPEKAELVFTAVHESAKTCEATFKAAIAVPEPKIAPKQRVVL